VIDPGLHIYLGTTGAGKTHKAFEDLKDYHARTKLGCVVIDSGRAKNFRAFPHEPTLQAVVQAVWAEKKLAYWTPRDLDELERFLSASEKAGGIAFLIDEIGFWPGTRELPRVCRVWRHAEVTILVTAQHVGKDLGQVLLGCNPTIYVFRTTAPRSLEWLEDWHELDQQAVRAQSTGVYIEKRF